MTRITSSALLAALAVVSLVVLSHHAAAEEDASNIFRSVRLVGRQLAQARSPQPPRAPRSPWPPRSPRSRSPPPPPLPPPKPLARPPPQIAMTKGYQCPDKAAILSQTNVYRVRHQAPALVWDDDLEASAAAFAQKLASASCSSYHSGGKDYGENIMMVQQLPKPNNDCMIAMKSWYAEVYKYDFATFQAFSRNWPRNVGHFTQMVWKATGRVGCGLGVADLPMKIAGRPFIGGCKMIVCHFKTFGNVGLDVAFLRNVLPNITTISV